MAVINKIRKQSGLLIIVIGVAMGAFVLGDFMRGGSGGRGQQAQDSVGTIYGEKVDRQQYENRVEQAIQSQENSGQQVTSEMRQRIRDQVWNNMVRERVMMEQIEKLGITISKAEFRDIIAGDNVSPRIKQIPAFQDPATGQFQKDLVLQRLKRGMQSPEFKQQWMQLENELKKERLYTKYLNLIEKGLYATSTEAKRQYQDKNRTVTIDHVAKAYREIPDSTISYTEEDVEAYYEEHKDKARYEQERSRSFEYIVFDIQPSSSDSIEARQTLEQLLPEFKKSRKDSLFAINNSSNRQTRLYGYYQEAELPERVDSLIMNSDSGEVIGPYVDEDHYELAKIKGFNTIPDSAKARHILLRTRAGRDVDSLRNVMDSLKQVIEKEDNFAALAQKISEDRSAQKGGDLGWFGPRDMVPAFSRVCFEGQTGDLAVVRSRFGIHLIEVLEQSEAVPHARLLVMNNTIRPSRTTLDSVYNKASQFAINNNTSKLFDRSAREKGYRKQLADKVKESTQMIARLPNSRKLVRWAYTSELGTVSEPFRCGEQYVVTHLTEVREEGVPELAAIREQIVQEVIKEKKGEKYEQLLSEAKNLEEVANKIGGRINSATLTFNNTAILGMGQEPEVVAKIMTLEEGYLSKPLKGNSGIYVALVKKIEEPDEPGPGDLLSEKQEILRSYRSRTRFAVFNALKELANVEDDRYKIPNAEE